MSVPRDPVDARWFSSGQQTIQQQVGTRQHAYYMAKHGIFSSYIPKHQQAWLSQQPMVYASIRNPITQQVWVTPLYAHIHVDDNADDGSLFHPIVTFLPTKKTDPGSLVCIQVQSRALHDPFDTLLMPSSHLALVFVDFITRDRFRMNGHIEKIDDEGNIYLRVKHSFGFCPKYVKRRVVDVEQTMNLISQDINHSTLPTTTTRSPTLIHDISPLLDTHSTPFQPHLFPVKDDEVAFSLSHLSHAAAHHDCVLPAQLVSWLLSCDDMFVGSSDPSHNNEVGYKGGSPGFLRVLDARVIIYPDYVGNPFFTVLGNSVTYPQMALCFIDYTTGHILQLTGVVSFQSHVDGIGKDLDGADRHVIFRITEWRLHNGMRPSFHPILWRDLDSSSHNYRLHDVPVVPLLHEHIISEFQARGMNEDEMESRFETRLRRDMANPISAAITTSNTSSQSTSTIYHGTSQEAPCMMRVTAIISEDHPMNPSEDTCPSPSILTYEFEVFPIDNPYTQIQYQPGQYATFDITLPTGIHVRRSWTISKPLKRLTLNPQHDDITRLQHDLMYTRTRFCISVKRKSDGRVSPWLHDHVGVGTKFKLIGIEGTFVLPKQPTTFTTTMPTPTTSPSLSLVFFTAGVGITPAIAFLTAIHDLQCRATTSTSCSSSTCTSHNHNDNNNTNNWLPPRITLFHSERDLTNVPFTSTIYPLLTHTHDNLMKPVLSHVHLSITATPIDTRPDTSHLDPGFVQYLDKSSHITMNPSRVTLGDIKYHMSTHDASHTHVYICGPHPFQQHVVTLLEHVGVLPSHIHMEQFDY